LRYEGLVTLLKIILAVLMVGAGAMHFVSPRYYLAIVPRVLPYPAFIVAASGVAEIALGAGLLFGRTQVLAAWGLIALFVAVFPANVSQALRRIPYGKRSPSWLAWARLPLQAVFIAWAWAFT
jgi:uncharacterized membrane protein